MIWKHFTGAFFFSYYANRDVCILNALKLSKTCHLPSPFRPKNGLVNLSIYFVLLLCFPGECFSGSVDKRQLALEIKDIVKKM